MLACTPKQTSFLLAAAALAGLTAAPARARETPALSLLPAAQPASSTQAVPGDLSARSTEATTSTPAAPPLVTARSHEDAPHFTLGTGVCLGLAPAAPDSDHKAADAIVSVDAGIEGGSFRFAVGGCNNVVLSAELGARGTWLPERDGFGPMLGGWAGVDWQTQGILDNHLFTATMALAEAGMAYRTNGHTRTMVFARVGVADVTVNGAHPALEPFVGVAAQWVFF